MLARHELSALCPRKHYNSISSSSSHVAIVKTAEGEYKSQASTFFLLHPTYSPVRLDWALYMLLSRALLPSFPPSLHPSAPDTFTFALLASANVMQVGTECVCVCASVIVWSIFCRCTPFFLFFLLFPAAHTAVHCPLVLSALFSTFGHHLHHPTTACRLYKLLSIHSRCEGATFTWQAKERQKEGMFFLYRSTAAAKKRRKRKRVRGHPML